MAVTETSTRTLRDWAYETLDGPLSIRPLAR